MWANLNKINYEEWLKNIITLWDFQAKYPHLYTLCDTHDMVIAVKYQNFNIDLIWILLGKNILLAQWMDKNALEKLEQFACVELYNAKVEVSKILNK